MLSWDEAKERGWDVMHYSIGAAEKREHDSLDLEGYPVRIDDQVVGHIVSAAPQGDHHRMFSWTPTDDLIALGLRIPPLSWLLSDVSEVLETLEPMLKRQCEKQTQGETLTN